MEEILHQLIGGCQPCKMVYDFFPTEVPSRHQTISSRAKPNAMLLTRLPAWMIRDWRINISINSSSSRRRSRRSSSSRSSSSSSSSSSRSPSAGRQYRTRTHKSIANCQHRHPPAKRNGLGINIQPKSAYRAQHFFQCIGKRWAFKPWRGLLCPIFYFNV